MAQIDRLRRSVALETESETGQSLFPGYDETEASHRDGRRRSLPGGRAPRETAVNLDAGPADAAQLEFKHEPDVLGGGMGDASAGRARRGRRPPRAPRAVRGREAGPTPHAAPASATDDRQDQARAVAPQGEDVEAPPTATADAREAPQSAPADVYSAPGRDEVPSDSEETARTNADDPARPKRSGWWQRARAS
ncbi:MAG: hypothetical protein ACREDH_05065 [Methylocella sp.]